MVAIKPHQGDTEQDESWLVFKGLGGPLVKKGMRNTDSGKPSKSLKLPNNLSVPVCFFFS